MKAWNAVGPSLLKAPSQALITLWVLNRTWLFGLFLVPGHFVPGQTYSVPYQVIASGGGTSYGTNRILHGTVGQPTVTTSTNGSHTVRGGFWPAAQVLFPPVIDPSSLSISMPENGATNFPVIVEDYDSPSESLVFDKTSSNWELLFPPLVEITGSAPWNVEIRPSPLRSGVANMTMEVTDDDGLTGSVQLTVAVQEVPVRPGTIRIPQMGGCEDFLELTANLTGLLATRYQWRLNGVNLVDEVDPETRCLTTINGANTDRLVLSQFEPRYAGSYSLVIENASGTKESEPVIIEAAPAADYPEIPAGSFPQPTDLGPGLSGKGYSSNEGVAPSGDPLEPTYHADQPATHPAWFSWRAPDSIQNTGAVATFRTQGSTFDTVLAIHATETGVPSPAVASDDESGGFHTSLVRFVPIPGRTYLIVVDGIGGQTGRILLSWDLAQEPAILQHPANLSVNLGDAGAGTARFVVDARDRNGGTDLLYEWQIARGASGQFERVPGFPTFSNVLTFPVTNAASQVGLYRVVIRDLLMPDSPITSLPATLEIIQGRPLAGFDRTFDRLVDAIRYATNFIRGPNPAALLNQRVAPMSAGTASQSETAGSIDVNNRNSTSDKREAVNANTIGDGSRWAVAPGPDRPSLLRITTRGSGVPTVLEVFKYLGGSTELLERIANSTSGPPPGFAEVSFRTEASAIYIIRVDTTSGPGDITLDLAVPETAVGPTFATVSLGPLYDGPVIIDLPRNGLSRIYFIQGRTRTVPALFNIPFNFDGEALEGEPAPVQRWVRFEAVANGYYTLAVEKKDGSRPLTSPTYASPLNIAREAGDVGRVRLTWNSRGYILEFNDHLAMEGWQTVDASSSSGSGVVFDDLPPDPGSRFYRLNATPVPPP